MMNMAHLTMDSRTFRSRFARALGTLGLLWLAILFIAVAPATVDAQERDLERVVLETATKLLFEWDMVPPEGGHVALVLRHDNVTSLPSEAAILGRSVEQLLSEYYDHSLQAASTLEETAGTAFAGLPESRQLGSIRFTRGSLSEVGGLRRSGTQDRQSDGVDAVVYFYPDAWILESGTVLIELMLRTPRASKGRAWFVKLHMLLDQGADGEWSVQDHTIVGRGS